MSHDRGPEASSGPDPAIVSHPAATGRALNDEIVMIKACRKGKFGHEKA
jgi:hypothetical protein